MKELSIEQKAQRYDEAIEKLRTFYRDYDTVSCLIDVKEELANLFPELKESEDEKIRQFLIREIEGTSDEIMSYRNMNKKDVLAWLERQGEPTYLLDNSESNVKFPFKAKVKLNGKIVTIQGGQLSMDCKKYVKYVSNTEDGYKIYKPEDLELVCNVKQKPFDKVEPKFKVGQTIKKEGFNLGFNIVKIEDGFYYNDMGDYFPFTDQDNWELVEKKPAWSEEDDRMFNRCIKTMKGAYYLDGEALYWLENRFKSLIPQNTWKPSEEQMDALNDVISSRDVKYDVLSELWKDLKKLREE